MEKGRSYMVEAGEEYDAQQAEYCRRALEGKEPPPASHRSSEEEDSPGGPLALLFLEEPQVNESLKLIHLPLLKSIQNLMSEDDYLDVVSSILEQGDPPLPPEREVTDFSGTPQGAHKLDSIPEWDEHFSPFRPSKATPPRFPRDLQGRRIRTWSSKGARYLHNKNWQDSYSRYLALQIVGTPALVFDVDNDWRLRLLPLPVVGVIRSGEDLPDAPPWSTGAPRDEPDGHEWQFYDPAPEN